MVLAVSITICSTIFLILTYSYLFHIERKRFIGIWLVGWMIYLIGQVISLIIVSGMRTYALDIISHVLFLISSMLLLWGVYWFLNKKMSDWCIIVYIISMLWIIIAVVSQKSFVTTISFPNTVVGISNLWVGIIFFYYGEGQKNLHKILGSSFILWGIHKLDYPILRNVPWFAPWGFLISTIISIIVTISFILINFEKIRTELIGVQNVLLSSEKKLVNIIENQSDIIFELDKEGCFLFVSPACLQMTGYKAEQKKGNPLWGLLDWIHGCKYKRVSQMEFILKNPGLRRTNQLYM
jgi:PAS domain-containing protein